MSHFTDLNLPPVDHMIINTSKWVELAKINCQGTSFKNITYAPKQHWMSSENFFKTVVSKGKYMSY